MGVGILLGECVNLEERGELDCDGLAVLLGRAGRDDIHGHVAGSTAGGEPCRLGHTVNCIGAHATMRDDFKSVARLVRGRIGRQDVLGVIEVGKFLEIVVDRIAAIHVRDRVALRVWRTAGRGDRYFGSECGCLEREARQKRPSLQPVANPCSAPQPARLSSPPLGGALPSN